MSFCYTAITKETPIEDSVVEIERVAAEVVCSIAIISGPPKYWDEALADTRIATLQCPNAAR